jgi:hypothetical protein
LRCLCSAAGKRCGRDRMDISRAFRGYRFDWRRVTRARAIYVTRIEDGTTRRFAYDGLVEDCLEGKDNAHRIRRQLERLFVDLPEQIYSRAARSGRIYNPIATMMFKFLFPCRPLSSSCPMFLFLAFGDPLVSLFLAAAYRHEGVEVSMDTMGTTTDCVYRCVDCKSSESHHIPQLLPLMSSFPAGRDSELHTGSWYIIALYITSHSQVVRVLAEACRMLKKVPLSTATRLAAIRERKNPVVHASEIRVPLSTAAKLASFREKKAREGADVVQATQLCGTSDALCGQHFFTLL